MQIKKRHENFEEKKVACLSLLLSNPTLYFKIGRRVIDGELDLDELSNVCLDPAGVDIGNAKIQKLTKYDQRSIEANLNWARHPQHHIIVFGDKYYPALLQEIPNPPLLFFAVGKLEALNSFQLAIVGSRNPTPSGSEIAYEFSYELAEAGMVIISGLAIGIDAASHSGALASSGKTVAVLGAGLSNIYPRCNVGLANKIVESGGLLISEFAIDDKARPWHFPLRNRIISGLSLGTLVVEATLQSGSLITARYAAEQGREVFAIPGSINNSKAYGCHYLIRQGAKLVEKTGDILEEFPDIIKKIKLQDRSGQNTPNKITLDCEHEKLLDCIRDEVVTIDSLVTRSGLTLQNVGQILFELELIGLVTKTALGYTSKRKVI